MMHILSLICLIASAAADDVEIGDILGTSVQGRALEEGSGSGDSGSGTSPPPSPVSPPGAPGAQVATIYKVVLVFTAAGDVSDYPPTMITSLASVVASNAGAGVAVSDVAVTVEPGSVIITSEIVTADAAASTAVTNTVATAFNSPAAASALFSAGGITVDVTSAPTATAVVQSVVIYDSAPKSAEDEMETGAIVGIVIGGLAVVGLAVAGAMYCKSSGGGKDASSQQAV